MATDGQTPEKMSERFEKESIGIAAYETKGAYNFENKIKTIGELHELEIDWGYVAGRAFVYVLPKDAERAKDILHVADMGKHRFLGFI